MNRIHNKGLKLNCYVSMISVVSPMPAAAQRRLLEPAVLGALVVQFRNFEARNILGEMPVAVSTF